MNCAHCDEKKSHLPNLCPSCDSSICHPCSMKYRGELCSETKLDMSIEQERKKQEKKTSVQECPKCNKPMKFHGQIAFCGCGLVEPKDYHLSGRNRDIAPESPKATDKLGEFIHYAAMGLSMERQEDEKKRDKSPERPKKQETVKEKKQRLREQKEKIEGELRELEDEETGKGKWSVLCLDARNKNNYAKNIYDKRDEAERAVHEFMDANWTKSKGPTWEVRWTKMFIRETNTLDTHLN